LEFQPQEITYSGVTMRYILLIIFVAAWASAKNVDSDEELILRNALQTQLAVTELPKIISAERDNVREIQPTHWADSARKKGVGRAELDTAGITAKAAAAGNTSIQVVPWRGPDGKGFWAIYMKVVDGEVKVKRLRYKLNDQRNGIVLLSVDEWITPTDEDGNTYATLADYLPENTK